MSCNLRHISGKETDIKRKSPSGFSSSTKSSAKRDGAGRMDERQPADDLEEDRMCRPEPRGPDCSTTYGQAGKTELVETYPVQVVTGWLGNTPSVAMRHYLMTTEEHFEAAVKGDEPRPKHERKSGAKSGAARPCGSQGLARAKRSAHVKNPGFAGVCE